MKYLFTFLLIIFTSISFFAQTKKQADSLYIQGDYLQAKLIYQELLTKKDNPFIQYNLGNTLFQLRNYPLAILAYERAYRYIPTDNALQHNLKLAYKKIGLTEEDWKEHPFIQWYKAFLFCFSTKSWQIISLICLILGMINILILHFTKTSLQKKIVTIASFVFFSLVLLTNIFAFLEQNEINKKNKIIITTPTELFTTPSENKPIENSKLIPGYKATLLDTSLKGWWKIRLNNYAEGWIKTSSATQI